MFKLEAIEQRFFPQQIHDSIFQEKPTLKIYRRVNDTLPFEW